jgi:hypothetical protein
MWKIHYETHRSKHLLDSASSLHKRSEDVTVNIARNIVITTLCVVIDRYRRFRTSYPLHIFFPTENNLYDLLWKKGNVLPNYAALRRMPSSGMLRRVALVTDVSEEPHGVSAQKTAFFIATVVKTSNLTYTALYLFKNLSYVFMSSDIH